MTSAPPPRSTLDSFSRDAVPLFQASGRHPGNPLKALRLSTTLAIAALGVPMSIQAGTFVDSGVNLPGVVLGAVAFGDYDGDGKLDILLTGNGGSGVGYITQIWHNQGNGTFVNINAGLPGLFKSSAAWGDYNKDGKLDILIAGLDSNLNPTCQIWQNQGNGTFANANVLLPGISGGSVAWGDFNNDGNLDVLLTGSDINGNPLTQIWLNQGGGTFSKLNTTLTPVSGGAVAVADFDNDGYPDILLTGLDINNNPVTQIWRNLGNGTFANMPISLPPVSSSTVALGDYDGDGLIDILITGNSSSGKVSQVWHNLGNFSFSNINAGLPGVYSGAVAWGDFDNDGKPDIIISGYAGTLTPITQVWHNNGGGVFGNWGAPLTAVASSMVAVGDFNNDGSLDILSAGSTGSGFDTTLWQNLASTPNQPPTAPGGLMAVPTSTGVTLSWSAASDSTTPAAALTYNLRLGTVSGGQNLFSPSSDLTTGFHRLPQIGNLGSGLSTTISLYPGIYYWSVQAIDASYAGSPFSQEFSLVLGALASTTPATSVTYNSAYLNGTVNPRGVAATVSFQWGTTTAYGNTLSVGNVGNGTATLSVSQAAISLQPGTTYHYRIVASDAYTVTYGADQSFSTPAVVPPTLSSFTNVTTPVNTPTPPIPFTVSDVNVPLSSLVITATASDSTIVPAANLVLGGSGANRTLTITPASGAQGTTAITVSVSDGISSASKTFLFTAGASGNNFSGTVNASGGFAVGSAVGLTTTINVLVAGGGTNQLQFTGGILTGVVPK